MFNFFLAHFLCSFIYELSLSLNLGLIIKQTEIKHNNMLINNSLKRKKKKPYKQVCKYETRLNINSPFHSKHVYNF